MGHKYLEELETYDGPYWGMKNDEREQRWKEEEKDYGFSSTDTWSLDSAFYLWLYEHLRMYQEVASEVVDLHYHKFIYEGEEYYQDELIEMMLERIRFVFTEEYDEWNIDHWAYVSEIGEIWAIVLPAMWW
jgi:hypothetical protein